MTERILAVSRTVGGCSITPFWIGWDEPSTYNVRSFSGIVESLEEDVDCRFDMAVLSPLCALLHDLMSGLALLSNETVNLPVRCPPPTLPWRGSLR